MEQKVHFAFFKNILKKSYKIIFIPKILMSTSTAPVLSTFNNKWVGQQMTTPNSSPLISAHLLLIAYNYTDT